MFTSAVGGGFRPRIFATFLTPWKCDEGPQALVVPRWREAIPDAGATISVAAATTNAIGKKRRIR